MAVPCESSRPRNMSPMMTPNPSKITVVMITAVHVDCFAVMIIPPSARAFEAEVRLPLQSVDGTVCVAPEDGAVTLAITLGTRLLVRKAG